ncbi:PREDICTED: uncharacterized protein KIAA1210 homolog [Chrysochloris asiatica]|uniref:Uncharacterized protein KIAA1210 homolog n=1 Tax=Chrysochloris asiatica TaxID=185453 RepID=A0A9B0U0P6_CHRAS|nr:PREDICTED: uncharacterized protein KIAA1210 homolog [Chrysochloris asiatica]
MQSILMKSAGKKKSKFKAFKSFFGKKKRKEPEDPQGGGWLTPSLSSGNIDISSLKPIPADQLPEIRSKSNMGTKALSHESIFMLEPERERSASKKSSSPDVQRGRTRQSSSETSSELTRSPSLTSSQLSIGFSTPATSKGCLDSSAARHKMALNPRKQKIKMNLKATVKSKQEEEPGLPLASEEMKSTKPPKETDQKKRNKAGPSSQLQSNKAEISDTKTADQASSTATAGSQGYPVPTAPGRKRGRKGYSISRRGEGGPRGRSLKKSSRSHDLKDRSEPPSTKTIAKDSPVWHLPLEKQVRERSTTPQADPATPQELLSVKKGTRKICGSTDEARKIPVPQPIAEDMPETMVKVSGTKKREDRSSLSSVVKGSTTRGEAFPSVRARDQACMDPSHIQSEGKAASSLDSQNAQFKGESTKDTPSLIKHKSPRHVLQAFIAGAAERLPPISSPEDLERPEDCPQVSDTVSTSEEESGSEDQLAAEHSFQSLKKPEDEQEVSSEPKSLVVKLSSSGKPVAPRHSLHALGKPEDEQEIFSESENTSEEGSSSDEQLATGYSSQSLEKPKDGQDVFPESKLFVEGASISERHLIPRCSPQAWGEPENEEVSTGSNSYVEKYNSAEDWSSSEEDLSPSLPSQTWGEPEDEQEDTREEQQSPEYSPQPFKRPVVQQQISSDSTSTEFSGSMEPVSSRYPFQPWAPAFEQQVSVGSEGTDVNWDMPMKSPPSRVLSKHSTKPKVGQEAFSDPESTTVEGIPFMEPRPLGHSQRVVKAVLEQEISVGPEITTADGNIPRHALSTRCPAQPLVRPVVEQDVSSSAESTEVSMELLPPRRTVQPRVGPKAKQQVSSFPESTGSISVEQLPSKRTSQPLMNLNVEENVFSGSEGVAAERIISMEPVRPKYPSKSLTNPKVKKVFSGSTPVKELLPPGSPYQPSMRPEFQPRIISLDSMSASAERRGSVEPLLPKRPFESWAKPKFEQEASADSESTPFEGGFSRELSPSKHPSQTQMKPKVKQNIASGSKWSDSVEPIAPKSHPQPWLNPKIEQQVSTGPESDCERAVSLELLAPKQPPRSIVRHKVQQISSSFESAAVEGANSGKPLPLRYPAQCLSKSKVQEMSSRLENTVVEGGTPKKSTLSKSPSKSYVKFIAEQVFSGSESPAAEGYPCVDPLPPNYPSKSMVQAPVERQVCSGSDKADIEAGISGKVMPTKFPLQKKPEDQHKVFSGSENTPEKTSSHKQPPSRRPFQAAEFPPQSSPMGSVSVPVERSSPEKKLPPKHPAQALGDPEEKRKVYSHSMSATAEGTISESDPGSGSLPRASISPNKTKKYSQGSEDLKYISSFTNKPVKSTIAPAPGVLSPKKEVLKKDDENPKHAGSSPNVENLFGVKLRRIPSSQHKSEKQGDLTKLPTSPLGPTSSTIERKQQVKRNASQGNLGTSENLTKISNLAEKQQVGPKSDDISKKQPTHKITGKAPGQQLDSTTSELPQTSMVKQRQKTFQSYIPVKEVNIKKGTGARAEIKEPQFGRVNPANEGQQKTFVSNVQRQEKMAPIKTPKPTKSLGTEDHKMVQVPAKEKETRKSASLPAAPEEPVESEEPVWFSMAKKKAKAWSHIAEIM